MVGVEVVVFVGSPGGADFRTLAQAAVVHEPQAYAHWDGQAVQE